MSDNPRGHAAKFLATLVALSLSACSAPERIDDLHRGEVKLSYEDTFDAAISLIQIQGGTIDFCSKEAGILSGHYVEFGLNAGVGLIAFFIPVLQLEEAPRQPHYTVHLRALYGGGTEFTIVHSKYSGSSRPFLTTQQIANRLEQIAAERKKPPR